MDMDTFPVVPLPGAEEWTGGFLWGQRLDAAFPGQDADQFAMACAENDPGPATDQPIVGFVMLERGEPDEASWRWQVTFDNGSTWIAEGWCDYTGWDCQSALEWTGGSGASGGSGIGSSTDQSPSGPPATSVN